jgi:VWFA-related protein
MIRKTLLFSIVFLFVPALGSAQASSGTNPAESFTETIEVNLVNIDVVVTDKEGRRVRGLTREDFTLLEDGKPVEITHFQAPPLVSSDRAPVEGEPPETAAVPSRTVEPEPMNLLLFLDFSNLNLAQRRGVFRALEKTLAEQAGRVRFMVMTYDRRTAQIPLAFTEDRQAVLAALQTAAEQNYMVYRDPFLPLHSEVAAVVGQVANARRGIRETAIPGELVGSASELQSLVLRMRNTAEERKAEIVALLDLLRRVSVGLGGVDGRKALLYVGDRLSLVPGQSLYDEAVRLLEDPEVATTVGEQGRLLVSQLYADLNSLNISRDFEEILGEANSVGVTFYTLTPPNLEYNGSVERGSASAPGFQGRVPHSVNEEVKGAACMMSGDTGGLCQVGGTDLSLLLEETFEDFDAFYTLAFSPDREPDGKLHKIKVKVKDRKLRLRYRELYLNKPRADQAHQRLVAALTFQEEHDPLGMKMRFQAQEPAVESDLTLVPVEVRVPVHGLALVPEPGGAGRRGHLRLLVASSDPLGRSTKIKEYPLTFQVPEAHFAEGRTPPLFSQQIHLKLAAGDQVVAVGLWDEVGRVGSFLRREVAVGEEK